jgi:serine/threonine-protein kinase
VVGDTVSHYRILEKIGEGGMGEVYLAEDTSLKRTVALKFLPESLRQDDIAHKRFLREAQSAAALDHPFICHINEVTQTDDGQDVICMEYVEGETLRERLVQGRLPLTEALRVGSEISEALEEAHRNNIVHRDLKPANIMLTRDGHAKVMDFGLAKRVVAEDGTEQEITATLTREGSTLGTLAYMSPEQIKAEPVDHRSDIFSFGIVLYEMLTGVHPFRKAKQAETIAAILDHEATPLSRYTEEAPILLQYVVSKMLAKVPDTRYQLVHEVRTDLEQLKESGDMGADLFQAQAARVSTHSASRAWRWVAPLILTTAVVASLLVWNLKPIPEKPVVRAVIELPQGQVLTGDSERGRPTLTAFTLSPDGDHLVFSAGPEGPESDAEAQLFVRNMDSPEAVPIPGTEAGIAPFFSADGQWIAFFSDNALKKVPLDGGRVVRLCELEYFWGGSWGPDGSIVFSAGRGEEGSGLYMVSATGGKPRLLTSPDPEKGESSFRLPHMLPDGESVLFTVLPYRTGLEARIEVLSLETGDRKQLVEAGADARFIPTEHIVFGREGSLVAVPFDLESLELTGNEVSLIDGTLQSLNATSYLGNSGAAQFSFSMSGTFVWVSGGVFPDLEPLLFVGDRRGVTQPLTATRFPYWSPRISPDGERIAYMGRGRNRDLWVHDISRGTTRRLTFEGRGNYLVWHPDGKRLAFGMAKSGPERNIYWIPADGSGEPERLTTSENSQFVSSWSPDGEHLLYLEQGDIWLLRLEDRLCTPFTKTPFKEGGPALSPDGRWLAYTSDETGQSQVYLQPFPGPGRKIPVSPEGGTRPLWASDGKELFYHNGDNMIVVEVTGGDIAGKPRLL